MGEEHRIRTYQFKVTLLPEERAMLEANAAYYGLTKSDYLRKLILAETLLNNRHSVDKESVKQILYLLGKIGTNINQIAYNTNVKADASKEDYRRLYRCFLDLLDIIAHSPYVDAEVGDGWQQHISMLLNQL